MPRDLVVRLVGDSSSFEKSLKRSTSASTAFETTLKKTAITAEQSARVQIEASVRKDQRLRAEIATYRAIASAAQKGSAEQVTAANLAARAERTLSRSLATTSAEAKRLSASTSGFERDLSRATRGVAAGSGVFRSLGRSLAFASGGFLAFGGGAAFIRKSIDAAKDAQVVNRQLAQQLKNDGKAFSDYRGEIDRTANRLSALAGIENDELKAGLTTILRTVPNVAKAERDLGTAADLARAKHISLAQAALIIAKTEAGNTTLLRRQGFQIGKNAKAEQALSILRQKIAGQARAGTTEEERFGAVLHNTEEIVGLGVLPTLNKYLASGSLWLEQMNESGKLQRDVATAAHDFETAVHDVAAVVRTVDSVTGSFKNTLELLLALKLGRWAFGVAGSFRLVGRTAAIEAGEVAGLRAALLGLSGPEILAGLAATYGAVKLIQNATKHTTEAPASFGPIVKPGETITRVEQDITFLKSIGQTDSVLAHTLTELNREMKRSGSVVATAQQVAEAQRRAAQQLAAESRITGGAAKHAALVTNAARRARDAAGGGGSTSTGSSLTASQRNNFFDNAIARILLRGGLGSIQAQVAALERADRLIEQRLAVTKDVTRKLRLEDELLQNQARIRDLKTEEAVAALQRGQEAHQRLVDALERRAAARQGRQFRELGFTATGENVLPGVARLKRELGTIDQSLKGTALDTPLMEKRLDRIRKVLSERLVPRDVRERIQEMFAAIDRALDEGTDKNLTKWRHLSEQAFLAGVPDLTPAQRRILEKKLSQLGPGGTVPGATTPAFASGRTDARDRGGDVYLDGEKVGRITKSAQIKRGKKRTIPRAG